MTIRAVTFDAAGTLIAPFPNVGAVYAEMAQVHGVDCSAEKLQTAFGPAFRSVQQRWGVPYGADEDDARRFWSEVISATFGEPLSDALTRDLYDTFAEARRWRVLPGAREALAWCRQHGLRTAVVSNFDCRLPPLLLAMDLNVDAVITSTMVGRAKPDPAPLRAAATYLQVALSEVLHVGDSATEDGGMCAALGVRFLHVEGTIPPLEFHVDAAS